MRRRDWHASPILASLIRFVAFIVPLVAAWTILRSVSDKLYRPEGVGGLLLWVAQATVIGLVVSSSVERVTRRLLPLASLFTMSLVFPDEAPSRFSIALRSSTVKQLRRRLAETNATGLGASEGEAATHAIALVNALGQHDRLTRGHTERVRAYSDMIAEELGLSDDDRAHLAWGAMLHDVGKITVPPEVLNKNGQPSEAEWEQLKAHPAESVEILAPLTPWLGDWLLAASQHHERWDGTGYPLGLARDQISLAGRITAVADTYDVITSKRSYKEPLSATAARQELVRCAGSQFDPQIVRAFLNVSLGRKWAVGPLAWLAEVPGLQLGGAAATNAVPTLVSSSVAAVSSAAIVVAASVAAIPPETLAMVEIAVATTTASVIEVEDTTTTILATPTTRPSVPAPTTTSSPIRTTAAPAQATSSTSPRAPTTIAEPTQPSQSDDPAPERQQAPSETATTTMAPATSTTVAAGAITANNDSVTVDSGKDKKIYVLLNDQLAGSWIWDLSSLTVISEPSNAKNFRTHNGHIHYKSDTDFEGADTLTYRICDTSGVCDVATATITVEDN